MFALDAEPDCVICHSNLGIDFGNRGLYVPAREHFELALKLRPDMALHHYHIGFVYGDSGNHGMAAEAYKTFLKRFPDVVDALTNLSVSLLRLHRPEEALVQSERRLKVKHWFVAA